MAILNTYIKKIINMPAVLNFGQDLLGANRFKKQIYGSVITKPGRILDFGCSYGNTAELFLNFDYYGVDIDCAAIEAAKRKFVKYPNLKFECLDILSKQLPPNRFDHILFASTSHHLSDREFRQILDALLVSLKDGGELHFFDIFRQSKDRFVTRLLTRFDQGKYIRTREQSDALFRNYRVKEMRVFESPDRYVKLWDFLYFGIIK